MAYIIGLVVVVVLFIMLHYFTDLNKSQKILTAAVLFSIISSAIAYNSYSYAQRDNMLNVVRCFLIVPV